MTAYVGFDRLGYPGDNEMQWLKQNTNLSWCGYYLAPAPSHSDQSWMGQRSALIAGGWGLSAIYVGQQTAGPGSHNVNAAQGAIDGADAASLAGAEGFPSGSFVYLDIEDGGPLTDQAQGYLRAWTTQLTESNYSPGIYCSHLIAPSVVAVLDGINPTPLARIWAFKVPTVDPHPYGGDVASLPTPDPSSSGFSGATALQYEQNIILTLTGAPLSSLTVDLSSATAANPSSSSAQSLAFHRNVRRELLARKAVLAGHALKVRRKPKRSKKGAPRARRD